MMSKTIKYLGVLVTLFWFASNACAQDAKTALAALQSHWADATYSLTDDAKEKAFDRLLEEANVAVEQYPDVPEILIWSGIIQSSYAGVEGGLGALKYVRRSREALERALELDDQALDGSAYTSLGALYYKVPGWPLSFGDDDKAEALLKQALSMNPDGIDPNYFFGEFLWEEGRYAEAMAHLEKALQAQPRPGRELADNGRKQEIMTLMSEVKAQLN